MTLVRRPAVAAAIAVLMLATAAAACSSGPSPEPAARAFLAAWQRNDVAAAGKVTDAPAEATRMLAATRSSLAVSTARLRLGDVRTDDAAATAAYTATLSLRGLGDWTYDGNLELRKRDGRWLVHWVPENVHPQLRAGQRLARTRSLPDRAAILDRVGRPLVAPTQVVTVSILPSGVRDRAAALAVLQRTLDVDPARVMAALRSARPNVLFPVITLRRNDYERVKSVLHPVPGLRFPVSTKPLPPTREFARAVLGTVGPATAEALEQAGPPYQTGDEVGISGLQAVFQRRLAGTPYGAVVVRDETDSVVATLFRFAGTRGEPVRTTLDRGMQAAAEAAIAGLTRPAALVAVRPSDGSILAVANRDAGYNRAFVGRYPPGSTFKIVTTVALLAAGLRPDDPVPCPPTITVTGKRFRNFEGDAAGTVSFARDFAISCNTAFVAQAPMASPSGLAAAARSLGIGAEWRLPLAAYAGSVPTPRDAVELAATAMGQGRVTVSPLAMALAAGAVASGVAYPPVLVTDPAQPAPRMSPHRIAAAEELRTLMRLVVTSGTAAPAFRSYAGPPVSGKTGTAEFGGGAVPATHAWFVGFRADVAFAVVVEGGGVGGRVAAPLAVRFLARLPG